MLKTQRVLGKDLVVGMSFTNFNQTETRGQITRLSRVLVPACVLTQYVAQKHPNGIMASVADTSPKMYSMTVFDDEYYYVVCP